MKQLYIFVLFISIFGFGQNTSNVVLKNTQELNKPQVTAIELIRFYLNPISHNTLRIDNTVEVDIKIYDVLGKLVLSEIVKEDP